MCTVQTRTQPPDRFLVCVPIHPSISPLMFHGEYLCLPQACVCPADRITKPAKAPSTITILHSTLQGQLISSWKACPSACSSSFAGCSSAASSRPVSFLLSWGIAVLRGTSLCTGRSVCASLQPGTSCLCLTSPNFQKEVAKLKLHPWCNNQRSTLQVFDLFKDFQVSTSSLVK